MKTHVLLVLMAFGCSPVMAEDRSAPWPLEIEGPAVYECLKTTEGEINPVTYWRVRGIGEKDADGNESFDLVRPPERFALVEDLGEVEMEEFGKSITYKVHEYGGICTFD